MFRRLAIVGVAGALLSSLGCSKERDSVADSVGYVSITASTPTVVANGSSSVTLMVTDTGSGPVNVTTTRGRFPSGATSATVAGAAGTLFLVTCNAAADPACAGDAVVTATSATGTTSVTVAFLTLADGCATSCNADPGCATLACTSGTAAGTCSSTSPSACITAAACTPSPAGATTETSCTDGIDNDCTDGADGDDAACEGQACKPGSPTFFWKSGACKDITSGVAMKLTPARTRLPADGTTSTTVVVEVTSDDQPVPEMVVSTATTLGTLSAPAVTTDANGRATFTFTSSATVGVSTITATLAALPIITQSAQITMPRLGSFQILPEALQHPVMGVKTSGWNELGSIQVQVLDDTGQPYPDGLAVRFEHRALGGSTLGLPLTGDVGSCVAPACVGHMGAISSGDGEPAGLATAFLHSGTVAGTLVVTATASAGGVTLPPVTLPTVAVVGAKASGANFAVVCTPRNVPALAQTDCSVSWVESHFTCAAIAKDRFNNVLGTATQVIFGSEAGAVRHVATTPAYDPTTDPAGQADLGIATQIFNTLGAGLPFDVDDLFPGEPSATHGNDGCGGRLHNPRDGVVTIVAMADGEEAFFDANGNGVYDAGEPYTDQGEPFIDQDDSGAWEPGEWFLDVDGNRAYDPPNETWDAAAKIWTQTVVVYTGKPTIVAKTGTTYLGTRWVDSSSVDACVATTAPVPFDVDPEQEGPPAVPATSDTYSVVASDMNMNRLHAGTTYAVSVQGDASASATYRGLASYADDLGFMYRYWPCEQAGAGACAAQCRATGAAAPCVMVPTLTDFDCGISAPVVITGGGEPDAGTVFVDWAVDMPYAVYGTDLVHHSLSTVSGTSN